jgi:sigma-B regulation protein RsbU (phosphoserine phosphatase)
MAILPQRRADSDQLDLLHRVSDVLGGSPDMDATMGAVLRAMVLVLPFDTASLFLLDRDGHLRVCAAVGYELDGRDPRVFPVGSGVVGWVVANRAPALVRDSEKDRRFDALDGRTPRSLLAVPLTVGERVLGSLCLVRRAPVAPFVEADTTLVATIANSAALALENARLHEQERALRLRLEELNQLYSQERRLVEQLERHDRVYSSVVSTVSHELRTPLMGIQGFARMIRDGDVEGAEVRDFAAEIHDNAVRLGRYVCGILSEDAVEQGHVTLELREVRLRPLADRVLRSFVPMTRGTHQLVNDVPGDLASARGDADRLTQIVSNLVSNAVKYSPMGGRIRVWGRPADGGRVELGVDDEGIGIPLDSQSRIFERFYRVATPQTRGITGAGVGLSIVKGLIDLHGGSIDFESEPGRGSSFRVLLPQWVYFPPAADYGGLRALSRPSR